MRGSDRIGERGVPPRRWQVSPEERLTRGKGSKQGAKNWGDGDDWLVVRRRRGKSTGTRTQRFGLATGERTA